MTRTDHHSHPTAQFPVYCLGFADDRTLLMGGGGGSSRTGILNKLKLCSASPDGKTLRVLNEYQFGKEEDSPWSLAVDAGSKQLIVGVNASETSIKANSTSTSTTSSSSNPPPSLPTTESNPHCRLLDYSSGRLVPVRAVQTIREEWSDDYPYQRFTKLNKTSTLLAIGTISTTSSQRVSILTFPALDKVGEDVILGEEEEMVDLDWSADGLWLAIASVKGIKLYSVTSAKDDEVNSRIEYRQTIPPPTNLDAEPVVFRSANFSRSINPMTSPASLGQASATIHAVLNNLPPKAAPRALRGGKKPQAKPQKAFVVNFGRTKAGATVQGVGEEKGKGKEGQRSADTWEVMVKREVGTKPVTVFEASSDGRLLAYASSDYSVGILDARTLAPLLKILHAHKFATTALAFNPSATLLASASADHTVRLIVVPASFGGMSMTVLAVIISLLLALLALVIQRRLA